MAKKPSKKVCEGAPPEKDVMWLVEFDYAACTEKASDPRLATLVMSDPSRYAIIAKAQTYYGAVNLAAAALGALVNQGREKDPIDVNPGLLVAEVIDKPMPEPSGNLSVVDRKPRKRK